MTGRRLALVGCPLLAILLYLPTLRHDFVFDDLAVIGQNPLMRDLRDLPRLAASPYWNIPQQRRSLYRPLTSLSFAIDRALAGGMHPFWFHLVNLALHGLATLLVTLLAFDALPGVAAPAAAGALFAAHPVHVEAVAGVVGRAEILALCGVVGAVLAHRRALRSAGGAAALRWGACAWITALLGMLAKESAVTAPLLCFLVDAAFPAAPAPPRRRRAWLYAGLGLGLGLYLLARFLVLGTLGVGAPIPFVDNPAAAAGPLDGRLTALGVVTRYAGLLVWPRHLSADYSFDQIPVIRSPLEPLALAGILLLSLLLLAGARTLRDAPAWGFALLWLPLSAAVSANLLVFIGTLMAERLLYLPSVGLCLAAGLSLAWLARRLPAGALVAMAVCAAASGRTWARVPEWRDDLSLYQSAARVSPRSARIRYNLGNAHLRGLDYREAEGNYRAALAIYPDFDDARVNLGMAILQQGRPNEALGLLEASARRDPRNPDLAVDLGNAYRALHDERAAEDQFRHALLLDPCSARAWNNLGSLALARGDLEAAVRELADAVRCDPGFATFRVNLGDALTAAGRPREADTQFREAHRIDPDLPEAHRGLGEVELRHGEEGAAEREFRIAAAGNRPSARAANFLGYILARRGDARAAAEQYERAISIDPRLADAHRSLGLIYAQKLGDPERAALHIEASLRIDPTQPGADELKKLLRTLRR